MTDNVVKVKVVEHNGKRLEFKEAIPVNSIEFVNKSLVDLYSNVNKLQQWFTAEQIGVFVSEELKLNTIVSLKEIVMKGNRKKRFSIEETSEKIFEEFNGKAINHKEIVEYMKSVLGFISPYGPKALVLDYLKNKIVSRNDNIIQFIKKIKTDEKPMDKTSYDNAKTNGIEGKELR